MKGLKRLSGVSAAYGRRHDGKGTTRVEPCNEDHGYISTGMYPHKCPTLALQRALKAKGVRTERYQDTLFVHVPYTTYVRRYAKMHNAALAKYEAWASALVVRDTWHGVDCPTTFTTEAEAKAFISTLADDDRGRYEIRRRR